MPSTLQTVAVSRRRVWRCIPKAFARTVLESGPSFTKDRRYSIQGEFGAVYLSGAKDLAQMETERRGGLHTEPMSYLEFELTVDHLVDLRDPATRAHFRVSLDDLVKSRLAPDRYTATQAVARRVYDAKLYGLIAPSLHDPQSAKPDWFNIALYPAHLLRSCLRPV